MISFDADMLTRYGLLSRNLLPYQPEASRRSVTSKACSTGSIRLSEISSKSCFGTGRYASIFDRESRLANPAFDYTSLGEAIDATHLRYLETDDQDATRSSRFDRFHIFGEAIKSTASFLQKVISSHCNYPAPQHLRRLEHNGSASFRVC